MIPCAGSNVFDGTPGTISGYINDLAASRNETNDLSIAAATLEKSTFGAEDPDAWDTWASGTHYSITAAFRPVVAGDITRSPGVGTLTLAGQAFTIATTVVMPLGTAALTGLTPTAVVNTTIGVPAGTLTASGLTPSVEITHVRQPAVGTLTVSGLVPDISTVVQLGSGALTFAGLIPTVVEAGGDVTVTPDAGTLTLTGLVPQRGCGLRLIGFAPTVIISTTGRIMSSLVRHGGLAGKGGLAGSGGGLAG